MGCRGWYGTCNGTTALTLNLKHRSPQSILHRSTHSLLHRSTHALPPAPLHQDLETTHNTISRRLTEAKANDDLFNRQAPPSPESRPGERIRHIPPTGFG